MALGLPAPPGIAVGPPVPVPPEALPPATTPPAPPAGPPPAAWAKVAVPALANNNMAATATPILQNITDSTVTGMPAKSNIHLIERQRRRSSSVRRARKNR